MQAAPCELAVQLTAELVAEAIGEDIEPALRVQGQLGFVQVAQGTWSVVGKQRTVGWVELHVAAGDLHQSKSVYLKDSTK